MTDDDLFDYALDWVDAELYDREPEPPECMRCNDRGCPGCRPRGRALRRMAHREWQRRDRASRVKPCYQVPCPPFREFDLSAPF